MRRKILTATAALTVLFSVSTAPANASVSGAPSRQSFGLEELVSWASSWFTGLWDADGTTTTVDPVLTEPDPVPTDPDTDDDRGPNLDPDG